MLGAAVDEVQSAILKALPGRESMPKGKLHTRTSRILGWNVDRLRFAEALDGLTAMRLVIVDGEKVRRSEADFPESELEPGVEGWLFGNEFLEKQRIDRSQSVFQKTTIGGRSGAGLWSRPDFTIATIRRRKYDPLRHLDVFAIELKNSAGAHVVAVHEALAHTRFAHYAFMACPSTELHHHRFEGIERSCNEHGVGLITFDIGIAPDSTPALANFRIRIPAVRQSPDPDFVDQSLDDRLNAANRERLKNIAGGT